MQGNAGLAQSEGLYRAIVETCPDGILVADLKGTIVTANTAAAELHGYERGDELIGVNLFDLVSPDDRLHMEQTLVEVLERGQVRHVEHHLLRRDAPFPADVNLSAVPSEDSSPLFVVAVIHDLTECRRQEEYLRYQALHDSLTGLPNRVLLYDRLEHALDIGKRCRTPVSLLVLDLDGFKEVNDRYGHDFGDAVLEQVAARFQGTLRGSDSLARVGGDEFAVVVADDVGQALHVADRLHHILVESVIIDHRVVKVGASIGIARYPVDGQDRATLFRRADTAMYAAKRSQCGSMVYTPDLGSVLEQF